MWEMRMFMMVVKLEVTEMAKVFLYLVYNTGAIL